MCKGHNVIYPKQQISEKVYRMCIGYISARMSFAYRCIVFEVYAQSEARHQALHKTIYNLPIGSGADQIKYKCVCFILSAMPVRPQYQVAEQMLWSTQNAAYQKHKIRGNSCNEWNDTRRDMSAFLSRRSLMVSGESAAAANMRAWMFKQLSVYAYLVLCIKSQIRASRGECGKNGTGIGVCEQHCVKCSSNGTSIFASAMSSFVWILQFLTYWQIYNAPFSQCCQTPGLWLLRML